MAIFGFSFGKKKQSGSTDSELTKNETTTQQQDSTKASTSTQNSTGTTTQNQTGTSSQSQTGTSAQTGTTQQTGKTTQFSSDILAGLEKSVGSLLGNTQLNGAVTDTLNNLNTFDSGKFVDETVQAATATERTNLDELLGGLSDNLGSSLGNNSMGVLLANRAQGDAAARIAGVKASATAQGQSIARENAAARVGAAGTQASYLNNLLQSLRGGVTESTEQGQQSQTGTTGQTQTGTTSQQGTSTESQQQVTNLLEQLSAMLNGTNSTVATENTDTKGKTSGGGISLKL